MHVNNIRHLQNYAYISLQVWFYTQINCHLSNRGDQCFPWDLKEVDVFITFTVITSMKPGIDFLDSVAFPSTVNRSVTFVISVV